MEYSHVQKWNYGIWHRMKEKRKKATKKIHLPQYEIKTDVCKQVYMCIYIGCCAGLRNTKNQRH
jgi:hypothetical protein